MQFWVSEWIFRSYLHLDHFELQPPVTWCWWGKSPFGFSHLSCERCCSSQSEPSLWAVERVSSVHASDARWLRDGRLYSSQQAAPHVQPYDSQNSRSTHFCSSNHSYPSNSRSDWHADDSQWIIMMFLSSVLSETERACPVWTSDTLRLRCLWSDQKLSDLLLCVSYLLYSTL